MAAVVHDRDEWLKGRAERNRRARAETDRRVAEAVRKSGKKGRWSSVFGIALSSFWHMGMYSSDPHIARMAIVHTAQEQLQVQRELAARQQLAAQAQRLDDQARDDARMERMAEHVARKLFDERDRREGH